jgi:NitT/TauT family transport system permease protein
MEVATPANTDAAKPWSSPIADPIQASRRPTDWSKAIPFIGPLGLFLVWDLVVRFGLVKPILLPQPLEALSALIGGLAGGPLLADFGITVLRTVEAF